MCSRFCPVCEEDLELQPEERDVGIQGLYFCPVENCNYVEEI